MYVIICVFICIGVFGVFFFIKFNFRVVGCVGVFVVRDNIDFGFIGVVVYCIEVFFIIVRLERFLGFN